MAPRGIYPCLPPKTPRCQHLTTGARPCCRPQVSSSSSEFIGTLILERCHACMALCFFCVRSLHAYFLLMCREVCSMCAADVFLIIQLQIGSLSSCTIYVMVQIQFICVYYVWTHMMIYAVICLYTHMWDVHSICACTCSGNKGFESSFEAWVTCDTANDPLFWTWHHSISVRTFVLTGKFHYSDSQSHTQHNSTTQPRKIYSIVHLSVLDKRFLHTCIVSG